MRDHQKGQSVMKRARLYREHKYLFHVLSTLLSKVGQVDFSDAGAVTLIQTEFKALNALLISHAEYEESRIHRLLQDKGSLIYENAQRQHLEQDNFFVSIEDKIQSIRNINNIDQQHQLGYELYLALRNFVSDNLNHFDYEENVIMPALQQVASDHEIREIDNHSYRQMSPEDMVHMMQVLFPHMNSEDKASFLKDICECEPEKGKIAWDNISHEMMPEERQKIGAIKSESRKLKGS